MTCNAQLLCDAAHTAVIALSISLTRQASFASNMIVGRCCVEWWDKYNGASFCVSVIMLLNRIAQAREQAETKARREKGEITDTVEIGQKLF